MNLIPAEDALTVLGYFISRYSEFGGNNEREALSAYAIYTQNHIHFVAKHRINTFLIVFSPNLLASTAGDIPQNIHQTI